MRPISIRALFAALLISVAAGRAEAGCQMTKVATWHVTVENNRILVPGSINGTPVHFVIATDIESLVLAVPAHDLHLPPLMGARHVVIHYAEGGPAAVDDIDIDGFKGKDIVMHMIGRRMNFGKPDEIAVIGRDILGSYDVEFNLPEGKINLFHADGCQDSDMAYWTSHYNQLDMEHHVRSIRVKATINGHEVLADINSGNPYTALSLAAAAQLGIEGSGTKVAPTHDFLADYPMDTWQRRVDSIVLDHEVIRQATLRLRQLQVSPPLLNFRPYWDSETGYARPEMEFVPGSRFSDRGAVLSLGVDFIRSHRMMISYNQYRVYFSYIPGEPFLTPANGS